MKIFKLYNQIMIVSAAALVLQACSTWPSSHSAEHPDLANMPEPIRVTPELLTELQPPETPLSVPQALTEYIPEPYTLGPGDKLFVTVWDYPELTLPGGDSADSGHNVRVIDDEGVLFFPFIGQLNAAGTTTQQLGRVLRARLERFIGNEPQVGVSVAAYESRWVMLQGAVKRPGELPITNKPLSLMQAVEAGQVDRSHADLSRLKLIRDGELYTLDYTRLAREPEAAEQIYLKHGDRILLEQQNTREVAVLGEVISPGMLTLPARPTNAAKALARAGGIAPGTADSAAVYIVRQAALKPKVFQLNASNPSGIALMSQFLMEPDDVLYVGANQSTRFTRAVNSLLSTPKDNNPAGTTDAE